MATLKERLESEIKELVRQGLELLVDILQKDGKSFKSNYNNWYTRSLCAIRELIPDRLNEFTNLYKVDKKKNLDIETYGIFEHLIGIQFEAYRNIDTKTIVFMKYKQQVEMLESAISRFDDILSNIRGIVQAEFLDSEIEAAKELLKANHLRAGGTVAGVILERHLARYCPSKGIILAKKNPAISELER